MDMREWASALFQSVQAEICQGLTAVDGTGEFINDSWKRPEGGVLDAGGGGLTRVMRDGGVFESAGVNFSEVHGSLPETMVESMIGLAQTEPFYATGVSLVLHPRSPIVPTVHANFRYLEVADRKWFGGGADLTPYYLFEEDARHFHQTWRDVCGEDSYTDWKRQCDEYFYLPHREECRGIGGIFFDYLGREPDENIQEIAALVKQISGQFLPAYLPIVERRKAASWTEQQRNFQLLRRGRYVEFNLVYDRGTQFGLKTKGRTESILMSLPPQVCWRYDYRPEPGSEEELLIERLKNPIDWL